MKRVKVSKRIANSEDSLDSLIKILGDLISLLEEVSNEYYNDAKDYENDDDMRNWAEGMAEGIEYSADFIRKRLRWRGIELSAKFVRERLMR